MKTKIFSFAAFAILSIGTFTSCKSTAEQNTISTPPVTVGAAVSDTLSGGTVKGTMLSGKTYMIKRDLIVQAGDTLLLQPGVKLKISKGKLILVKGVFISLGTKALPNYIGPDKAITKTDAMGAPAATDSAYIGYWTGLNCEPTCTLLDLKWTHLEYMGGSFGATLFPTGEVAGGGSKGILFQNPTGDFIMEDSWMYGSIDDAVRIACGRIHIMRNTYEKCGATGGDCLNAKNGAVGDMAYNLFLGTATNGTKASNKGTGNQQTNINMYNNTYISGGYRQKAPTGRGGSINYEEGAKGKAFNNLMVNCRTGVRIHNNPAADVANMSYGYNYSYGDSIRVMNNVYPVGSSATSGTTAITVPQATDIPAYTALLSNPNFQQAFLYATTATGVYTNMVGTYDGTAYVKVGDPKFIGFTLPMTGALSNLSALSTYNFRLQSTSPAINKGTADASKIAPIKAVLVTNANFKPSEVTLPGVDMGCFQSNGTGNQH